MTKEQKIEWLKNASNEELIRQYDSSLRWADKEVFNLDFAEEVNLCRAEIFRRMNK